MSDKERIAIFIVDDQQLTRLGLRVTLEKFSDFEVIGESDSGQTAITAVAESHPHVVLMDLRMPGMDGIEAAKRIKSENTDIRVLILTNQDHDDDVFAALAAGADGYSLKESTPEQLAMAIRTVSEGVAWLDPFIAKRALSACVKFDAPAAKVNSEPAKKPKSPLTERELEVLGLIIQGLSNKQIADKLMISLDTVKNHMRYILAKLAVADRTQAAVKALREGFFSNYTRE